MVFEHQVSISARRCSKAEERKILFDVIEERYLQGSVIVTSAYQGFGVGTAEAIHNPSASR